MPNLHERSLPQKDKSKITPALKKTCVSINEVYGCKPHQVWSTWEEIPSGFYVEGGNEASEQPTKTHPPICELTCFEGKTSQEIEKVLTVAANTLSEELGITGNIFMTHRESKSGRVIAGNGIVRK